MANNSENIHLAPNGQVFIAPVGTTAPTDVSAAWAAPWVDLGYLSDDGAHLTGDAEVEERTPWQSIYAVKRWVTARSASIEFTAWEWTKESIALAFGGGTFTEPVAASGVFKFSPKSDGGVDERSLGIEWTDDDGYVSRLLVPKGVHTGGIDTTFTRSELAMLPIEFAATSVGAGDPWYILSDNPAWDPTA